MNAINVGFECCLILRNTIFVLFSVLSSLITVDKDKLPHWFEEHHKCWIRLLMSRSTSERNVLNVHVSEEENVEVDAELWRDCTSSDLERLYFPNAKVILNVPYFKSQLWYKWELRFNYDGDDDYAGTVKITNLHDQNVFVF